jgi:hypothetical protein
VTAIVDGSPHRESFADVNPALSVPEVTGTAGDPGIAP